MTNKEASRDISHYIGNGCCNGSNALSQETLLTAVTALNKRVAKKPKDVSLINSSYLIGICPECGNVVDNVQSYCQKCGQAICWEV